MRVLIGLTAIMMLQQTAQAGERGQRALLELCDAFGETKAECSCYMGEVKSVYADKDIELAGGVARAFMQGEEPEAIMAYLLFTRKTSIRHLNALYELGDKHIESTADKCEDKNQKISARTQAKRGAMNDRLEKIGARYRIAD